MRADHSDKVEYRGLVVASKVKSRNIFSDIGSCFVGCCGGEIKDLSKLTNDIRQTRVLGTKSETYPVDSMLSVSHGFLYNNLSMKRRAFHRRNTSWFA